jgi:hypothetical protein
MKKKDKNVEHPEVRELKDICNITPNADSTKEVCDTLERDKSKADKKSPKRES